MTDADAQNLLVALGGGIWHKGRKEEGYYPHYHPNVMPNAHFCYFPVQK